VPTGDALTIATFLIGLAVTAGVAALSLIERKRKFITNGLFILAVLFGGLGLGWPWLQEISPKATELATRIGSNPVAWFVIIMFLAALLLFGRAGNKPAMLGHATALALLDKQIEAPKILSGIVVAASLTPQTTSPVLFWAKAVSPQDRLRIVLEYSRDFKSLSAAGWTATRQLVLVDIKDVIKGQEIRMPIVSCNTESGDVWWGRENDAAGNGIVSGIRYRAVLRFVASNHDEQISKLLLIRTNADKYPYIVAIFSEKDWEF